MRRIRRPRIRTLPGGTERRRRHRFPAEIVNPHLRRSLPDVCPPFEPCLYRPQGDVDALLWEHAADLVSAISQR
jgi:hypothetical protein